MPKQASSGARDTLDTHTEDRRFSGYQSDGGREETEAYPPASRHRHIDRRCLRQEKSRRRYDDPCVS